MNHANTLRKLGRPNEARQEYKHALVLEPSNVRALNGLGTLMMEEGRFQEAQDLFLDALAQDGDDLMTRNNLKRVQNILKFYGWNK